MTRREKGTEWAREAANKLTLNNVRVDGAISSHTWSYPRHPASLGCICPLFGLNLDLVFFECKMPVMLYFACSHNSKYTYVSILICLFVHGWAPRHEPITFPKRKVCSKSYIPMQRMDTLYWFRLKALFYRNYFHGELNWIVKVC